MAYEGWKERLLAEIEAVRLPKEKDNALSQRAGFNRNYIKQTFGDPKAAPRVHDFLRFCDNLRIDPVYVITGVRFSATEQEFVRLIQSAPAPVVDLAIAALAANQATDENH